MIYLRCFAFLLLFQNYVFSTWLSDIPIILSQPNGQIIECFVTGDQYSRRVHDNEDFTIIMKESDGFYYYADEDGLGGLIATNILAGTPDPSSYGLEPGYAVSSEVYERQKEFYNLNLDQSLNNRDAPSTGTVNQVNVFIRFADDPEFSQPRSYFDAVFQTDNDEPSLKHYFWEVSYNSLLVNTYHYPGTFGVNNTAYVDEFNRSYYQPYSGANPDGYQDSNQRTQREHTLLANAVNAISPSVPSLLDIDANGDGLVDAVSFVIYGGTGDWADLLWPHRWALYSQDVYINGARVYDYLFMLGGSSYFNVGVLAHEFGHVLGAPDYYHYDGGGAPTPVGGWDVMASNGNPPQYPSAFTKWKYFDWIQPIEITQGGTYTINPLSLQDSVAYTIASPYSETEYFILEYRKQEGLYDSNAQGSRSGLLAYRVNPNAGDGNAQGPPDELYIYRPGGNLTDSGNLNNAPYSLAYNQTVLNDNTDPSSFLYNGGSGGIGGLNLYGVTEASETISFTVSFGVPEMQIYPNILTYDLQVGEFDSQSFSVANTGEEGTVLNYSTIVLSSESYINPQGGPDGGGYFWTTSDNEPSVAYEWIDIEDISTLLNFPNNDSFSSEEIQLPFEFPFFDETYSSVNVNANGWIGWNSENETIWQNGSIPSPTMPRPAIFGFFDDLNPENENANASASGNIFYHVNDDRAVIWFDDVARWTGEAGSGIYDFQFVLFPGGAFKCNYRQMEGTLDQATIGWQNNLGNQGTEIISAGEAFASNNFSWEAKTFSNDNVPWLSLSSENGVPSGSLSAGEEINIFAQVNTSDLTEGFYSANVSVTSPDVDPQNLQVNLTVSEGNLVPTLPYIDISGVENGIVYLPENINPLFTAIADRYTHVPTPNGDVIPFLIQNMFTDEQVLHAKRVLESYLKDLPGTEWGANKSNVANAIGMSDAILFLLNDESEYGNPNLTDLFDLGVKGQDLLSVEVFPEGTFEYMNSTDRDATYEEILHFVHVYGIQIAMPAMQAFLENAMVQAMQENYYIPLLDLPEEDYDEEYLAIGLESYFGLWSHDPSGNGFCGDGEYPFIHRSEMAIGDPLLYNIIAGFFGETLLYKPALPSDFNSFFFLKRQENLDYTFRSQFITDIRLTGSNSSSIIGNDYKNHLHGNDGNNSFQGFMGDDTIYGGPGIDRSIYLGERNDYVIIPPEYTADSSHQIRDLELGRDGIDELFDVEEVQFNGVVYELSELLSSVDDLLPNKFVFHQPYPNPFNLRTTITFDLPKNEDVNIQIFDINGRLIQKVIQSKLNAGKYSFDWKGTDLQGRHVTSGVYFIKLNTGSFESIKKALLVK